MNRSLMIVNLASDVVFVNVQFTNPDKTTANRPRQYTYKITRALLDLLQPGDKVFMTVGMKSTRTYNTGWLVDVTPVDMPPTAFKNDNIEYQWVVGAELDEVAHSELDDEGRLEYDRDNEAQCAIIKRIETRIVDAAVTANTAPTEKINVGDVFETEFEEDYYARREARACRPLPPNHIDDPSTQ